MSLLERLRGLPDDVESVLLVGHNPAIEELAVALARPSPRRRDLEVKFPTGALATLTGPLPSWRGLDHDSVELVAFVRPRDL
jgi:phosphohistidine phosphatase